MFLIEKSYSVFCSGTRHRNNERNYENQSIKYIFSLFFLCILILGCSNQTTTNIPLEEIEDFSSKEVVSFEISFDKPEYIVGDVIEVKMSLRNKGAKPVLVNSVLFATNPYEMEELRSVSFIILDPSDEQLPYLWLVTLFPPDEEAFVILKPGEDLGRLQQIETYYDFSGVGVYTIQATYSNWLDHPDGFPAWKGVIESNVVTFEITL